MMFKEKLLTSLKDGMKAEMDSITLYKAAAGNSDDLQVKNFFLERMEEEQRHYNYLLAYYHQINADNEPSEIWIENSKPHDLISQVISDEFIKRIGENQILFSAISTAILLEKNAVDFYTKCETETEIKILKDFFGMLINWETVHYQDLLKVQKDAETYYWSLNRFEPF